jgi:hypothetical protein
MLRPQGKHGTNVYPAEMWSDQIMELSGTDDFGFLPKARKVTEIVGN